MNGQPAHADLSLVGVGLYTPAEAGQLLGIAPGKITRWLNGHDVREQRYDPLWRPQVDIGDGRTYLGFLDLVQTRMTAALIGVGLSPQRVRSAIRLAGEMMKTDHPFARARFRTDGRTLLLDVLRAEGDAELIDLFAGGQYVMRQVIEPSLRGLDFVDDIAARWWPLGRKGGIVVDPGRQFGRPVEHETGVPTAILAQAVKAEGSIEGAAAAYRVPVAAVRKALSFERRAA